MKKTLFSILAIVSIGLFLASCTKTVADNGADAVTSVFDIKASDWSGSGGSYTIVQPLSELTTNITDQGAVWIYFSYDGGAHYELLPSIGIGDANSTHFYNFAADQGDDNNNTDGYVTLYANQTDNGADAKPNLSIRVKVVSIPSSLMSAHPNVDKTNYNEVKSVFKLKD